jgi:uncharacterized membrane protein
VNRNTKFNLIFYVGILLGILSAILAGLLSWWAIIPFILSITCGLIIGKMVRSEQNE